MHQIDEIYRRAEERIRKESEWGTNPFMVLCYGPAHIVWSDGNYNHAEWCIENYRRGNYPQFGDVELRICMESLKELAAIPWHERDVDISDMEYHLKNS